MDNLTLLCSPHHTLTHQDQQKQQQRNKKKRGKKRGTYSEHDPSKPTTQT